jgi:transcriptional regulator with XRE-family HTH domain
MNENADGKSLREAVAATRKRLGGISQKELADLLGVSQATVSSWSAEGSHQKLPHNLDRVLRELDQISIGRNLSAPPYGASVPASGEGGDLIEFETILDEAKLYVDRLCSNHHDIDIWLLGPTTLAIVKDEARIINKSQQFFVENVLKRGARYHIIWNLSLYSKELKEVSDTLERSGGADVDDILTVFSKIESDIISARINSGENVDSDIEIAPSIFHVPVLEFPYVDPATNKVFYDERREYWENIQKDVKSRMLAYNKFLNVPDYDSINKRDERKDLCYNLIANKLFISWNPFSSISMYSSRSMSDSFAPVANIRFSGLTRVSKTDKPIAGVFFWLTKYHVKVIENNCRDLLEFYEDYRIASASSERLDNP